MDNQPQYSSQIQREYQAFSMRPNLGLDYEQQMTINNQQIISPKDKNFMEKVRHSTLGGLFFRNAMKYQCCGSGVLISQNLVLTAAHNLYDRFYQQKTTDHRFYLAGNGITGKYQQIQSFEYPPQYEVKCEPKYDFGLIKLKKSINKNEFLRLSVPCSKCIEHKDKSLSVYGYPNYNGNYSKEEATTNIKLYQYGFEKKDAIVVYSPSEGKICYSMSTQPGHSGSPVVVDNKIIAVHIGAAKTCQSFNMGRLVTPNMIKILKQWCIKLKGSLFKIDQQQCSNCFRDSLKNKYSKNNHQSLHNLYSTSLNKNIKLPSKESFSKDGRLHTQHNFYCPPFAFLKGKPQNTGINFKINPDQTIKKLNPQVKGISLVNKTLKAIPPKTNTKLIAQKLALSIFEQGKKKYDQKQYEQALKKFNEYLSILKQEMGIQSTESAVAYRWIGNTYYMKSDYVSARDYYEQSIRIYEKEKKVNDIDYAKSLKNLGDIYLKLRLYKIAVQIYDSALRAYRSFNDEANAFKVSQRIIQCFRGQKKMKQQEKLNQPKQKQQK